MYFWKTSYLVKELKENSLTESNLKNYYLVTSILTLVSFYLMALEPPTNVLIITVESIAGIGVTIFGLNYVFNANGRNSGKRFLDRVISISLPLLIKVLVAGLILGFLQAALEDYDVEKNQIEWLFSFSAIIVQIAFFWRLAVHVKNSNHSD